MIGIEFTMKDGSKDSYDPMDSQNDLSENDTHYLVNAAYKYEVQKSEVVRIRFYDLCDTCGYELGHCEHLIV